MSLEIVDVHNVSLRNPYHHIYGRFENSGEIPREIYRRDRHSRMSAWLSLWL